MKTKVKVKDLKVGMFINDNFSNNKILAFVPSRFQKNGVEVRRAKVKSINLIKNSPKYLKKYTWEIELGKMESFQNIETRSKYLP